MWAVRIVRFFNRIGKILTWVFAAALGIAIFGLIVSEAIRAIQNSESIFEALSALSVVIGLCAIGIGWHWLKAKAEEQQNQQLQTKDANA